MASLKIRTLEMELKQQSDFFKREEQNYEKQIESLTQDLHDNMNKEQTWNKDFASLLQKNQELQIMTQKNQMQMETLDKASTEQNILLKSKDLKIS